MLLGSRYNTVMKLVFLASSFGVLYMMTLQPVVKNTYDKTQDTFRIAFLIVPCAGLALLINQEFTVLEVRPLELIFGLKRINEMEGKQVEGCGGCI